MPQNNFSSLLITQVLFAVFDSVQGFVIITVHCAMRREVSPVQVPPQQPTHVAASLSSCASNAAQTPLTGEICVSKCHASRLGRWERRGSVAREAEEEED